MEIDPVAKANGDRLALQNMTKTYKDILGNSWQDTLRQAADEHKWMVANGITPPSELMKSGGQTESSKQAANDATA